MPSILKSLHCVYNVVATLKNQCCDNILSRCRHNVVFTLFLQHDAEMNAFVAVYVPLIDVIHLYLFKTFTSIGMLYFQCTDNVVTTLCPQC